MGQGTHVGSAFDFAQDSMDVNSDEGWNVPVFLSMDFERESAAVQLP